MAERVDVGEIIRAEREAVIGGLRDLAKRWDKESERHSAVVDALREEQDALALRGKTASVPVVEMAGALDVTRQRMHKVIADAEVIREAEAKRQKRKGGGDGA